MPLDLRDSPAAVVGEVPALVERFLRERTARRGATAEIPPPIATAIRRHARPAA